MKIINGGEKVGLIVDREELAHLVVAIGHTSTATYETHLEAEGRWAGRRTLSPYSFYQELRKAVEG